MKKIKPAVHFTADYLINPTNPITVNLIGAGGSGSQMLTALAKINYALVTLGHAGLSVVLYDDDIVSPANKGRQLFADVEIGLYKSVALINRTNSFFGTDWKAVTEKYPFTSDGGIPLANLFITCVDTIATRFELANALSRIKDKWYDYNNSPFYWMDLGNSQFTGQVILSSVKPIVQPNLKRYRTIGELPDIIKEYKSLLEKQSDADAPSCSLAEALEKQDLFINATLVDMGASLLWNLFRNGMTDIRGMFINLKTYRTQPILVG